MVITDKKTENTSETETKKNRKKRILIVLVGIGILTSIISSMISDDDSETVEKDVESIQTQIQPEIKSETTSEYSDISILVYSDIIFGSSKEEVTKMLQDKDWIIMGSYKEDVDSLVSALEFGINKEYKKNKYNDGTNRAGLSIVNSVGGEQGRFLKVDVKNGAGNGMGYMNLYLQCVQTKQQLQLSPTP